MQVAAAMQRLEEIAEEVYQSSAAGSSRAVKPESEAVPGGNSSAPSEPAPEDGSHICVLAMPGSCTEEDPQLALLPSHGAIHVRCGTAQPVLYHFSLLSALLMPSLLQRAL